jgi:hypothetical protein
VICGENMTKRVNEFDNLKVVMFLYFCDSNSKYAQKPGKYLGTSVTSGSQYYLWA